MTTSADVLDFVYQAILTGGTDAESRVYKPGDWPTQNDQYPITKMRLIAESRRSLGVSGPAEFLTTATLRLMTEVSAPATIDDAGATGAESQLWAIKGQNDAAVVNSYPLTEQVQQIAAMRSQLAFNSEGATHLAGIQTDIDIEFYEGPEDFAPVATADLDQLAIDIPAPHAGAIFALNQ